MRQMRIHRLFFGFPGTIFQWVIEANMKSGTELTVAELYALERATRLARAREITRLIRAGVDALVRFARRAVSVPDDNRKEISHA
jgi:hypothetical protein